MTKRYTCGKVVDSSSTHRMYYILDRGDATGAIGSELSIQRIYDDCEITGGAFRGITGEYYNGTYIGGEFVGVVCYDGKFTATPCNPIYDQYISETGDMIYG